MIQPPNKIAVNVRLSRAAVKKLDTICSTEDRSRRMVIERMIISHYKEMRK